MIYARIGAVFYILWGILHLIAAKKVYLFGQTLEPDMVQGRISQNAFYLLFFAVFGLVIAITLNWKNSKSGYWLNCVLVSFADIGFIVAILMPGYLPFFPGSIGSVLWLAALMFTTIGMFKREV